MFGIDSGELLIIALVALLVIGPKDLPRAMRTIGQFVGRARGMARHFRSGIDTMIREAELEEMEKQWKANNERIMRESPAPPADSDWGQASDAPSPAPPPSPVEAPIAAPSARQPEPSVEAPELPLVPPERPAKRRSRKPASATKDGA